MKMRTRQKKVGKARECSFAVPLSGEPFTPWGFIDESFLRGPTRTFSSKYYQKAMRNKQVL